MSPIIAFKLPILMTKSVNRQLLTLYLIRSNVHKKPYDPNYVKKARKRLKDPESPQQSIKPPKLPRKEPKSKSSSKSKESNSKSKSEKSKKSKSKPLSESKNILTTSSTQPIPSPSTSSKLLNKSRSQSSTEANKSTSQVLSIPSTSRATSTQYKNVSTTKTTPPNKRTSESSSRSSSTSKSDSTAPRTPLKSNAKSISSNYPSPSPPKPKKLKPSKRPKEPKASEVSSTFGNFKIPKKPKVPVNPNVEKNSIPKRLQPSEQSPIDLIIGYASSTRAAGGTSSTSTPNRVQTTQPRESQNTEEDLDPLEPELDFDLYGGGESTSQPLDEDFSSQPIDPISVEREYEKEDEDEDEDVDEDEEDGAEENEEEEEEEEKAEDPSVYGSLQNEPIDQNLPPSSPSPPPLPNQSILKHFDDESESSDDEVNFKRRGGKDTADSDTEMSIRQKRRDQIVAPIDSSKLTKPIRSKPIPINQYHSTPKVVSLRSTSLSRPQIPESLPSQPPPLSKPSVQSVITTISRCETADLAMKKFLEAHKLFPQIFAAAIPKFQTLFKNLLLNLFRDVNFMFNQERFMILLNEMRQLNMNDSDHWEDIICSWGRNYESLVSNQEKLENVIKTVTNIYNHLQSNQILINLPTAGNLYQMKMDKTSDN